MDTHELTGTEADAQGIHGFTTKGGLKLKKSGHMIHL